MSSNHLSPDLLARVDPGFVARWAEASGWAPVPAGKWPIRLFNHPTDPSTQLLIPLGGPPDDSFCRMMADVVVRLAQKDDRPPVEVLHDLLLPGCDVLRFRVAEPGHWHGSLLLDQAVGLLQAVRQVLRAACQLVPASPDLPAATQQFLQTCRLGQPEGEGLTFVVGCPLGLAPPGASPPTPFAREAIAQLMGALAHGAQTDGFSGVNGSPLPDCPGLGEVLLGLRLPGEPGNLKITVTWSPDLPPPEAPAQAQFGPEDLAALEGVVRRRHALAAP